MSIFRSRDRDIPDDKYLELIMARAIQTDHLLYGINPEATAEGYKRCEQIADRILREYVNPRWKSASKFDSWWEKMESE